MDAFLGSSGFWILAVSLPLLAALLLAVPPLRQHVACAVPWMAAPALALALWAEPSVSVDLPWVLLGSRLEVDDTGRVFLIFTAALWMICGRYARANLVQDPRQHRFFAFFLTSMTGNLGTVLAADMITFYFFFALMSFASYGLVVHEGGAESLRAGRVYIAFVIAGEILLFLGITGIAGVTGSTSFSAVREALSGSSSGSLMLAFVLIGFAIKTGTAPLHPWVPLAYRAAPIPASAALSGPMIKAGLLGWLRFLPIGETALPVLGMMCIAGGLTSAFGGVAVGLTQNDPKAALGYSSISQMGLMTIGVGVGLLAPESWALILPAIWLYALHHALAKAALFLGVGAFAHKAGDRWQDWMAIAGLLLPAMALAGVPFTSGAVAKIALKKGIESAPFPLTLVEPLSALAAVGTTLLMARFVVLAWRQRTSATELLAAGIAVPSIALSVGLALAVWWLPWAGFGSEAREVVAPAYVWDALWPPVVGLAIAWGVWRLLRRFGLEPLMHIPPGDLLSPLTRFLDGIGRMSRHWVAPPSLAEFSESRFPHQRIARTLSRTVVRAEGLFQRWDTVGVLVVVFVALLAFLGR